MPRNSGFTLLESLVSLLMLSGILLLLAGLIQHVHKMEHSLSGYHQLEWEVFLLQLDNELADAKYQWSSSREIWTKVQTNKGIVDLVIKKDGQRIIKKQTGGYQPLLTGVRQFSCQEKNHGVDFVVTFTDGKQKEGTWIYE